MIFLEIIFAIIVILVIVQLVLGISVIFDNILNSKYETEELETKDKKNEMASQIASHTSINNFFNK